MTTANTKDPYDRPLTPEEFHQILRQEVDQGLKEGEWDDPTDASLGFFPVAARRGPVHVEFRKDLWQNVVRIISHYSFVCRGIHAAGSMYHTNLEDAQTWILHAYNTWYPQVPLKPVTKDTNSP